MKIYVARSHSEKIANFRAVVALNSKKCLYMYAEKVAFYNMKIGNIEIKHGWR